jgi:hypothetical protein
MDCNLHSVASVSKQQKSLPWDSQRVKRKTRYAAQTLPNKGILNTMNEDEFRSYLKSIRRKESAIEQIISYLNGFELFLKSNYAGISIEQTNEEVLESYVSWVESDPGESASKPLWALRYYFDYLQNRSLSQLSGQLRAERIKRKPFYVRDFRGVQAEQIAKLETINIENVHQMIDAGRTPDLRKTLAKQSGLSEDLILEYVTLSDLSRLGAVRSVRARLYYESGLTPEKIAAWEPEALREMLVDFVDRTGFEGIAPLPKEVKNLIKDARSLPMIVIY